MARDRVSMKKSPDWTGQKKKNLTLVQPPFRGDAEYPPKTKKGARGEGAGSTPKVFWGMYRV